MAAITPPRSPLLTPLHEGPAAPSHPRDAAIAGVAAAALTEVATAALTPTEETTTSSDHQTILGQLTEEQREALQPFLDHKTAIKRLSPDDVLNRLLLLWLTPAAALAMDNVDSHIWTQIAQSPALLSHLYNFACRHPQAPLEILETAIDREYAFAMRRVVNTIRELRVFANHLSPEEVRTLDWSQLPKKIDAAADRFLPPSAFLPSSIPEDPADYPAFFERHNLAPSATSALPPGPPYTAGQDLAALLSNWHPEWIEFQNPSEEPISIQIEYSDGTLEIRKIRKDLPKKIKYDNSIVSLSVLTPNYFFSFSDSVNLLFSEKAVLTVSEIKPQGLHFKHSGPASASPAEGKAIPSVLFEIWLGKPFPEKYWERILSFKERNPDHTIVLLTDCTAANLEEYPDAAEMRKFCAENNIKLVNIYELAVPLLQQHGLADIFATYIAQRQFGAASDLLRIVLLYTFGGTYADADRACYRPLSSLQSRYQLVVPSYGNYKCDFPDANDFLMSAKNLPFWLKMRDICQQLHTTPCFTLPRLHFTEKENFVLIKTGPGLLTQAYQEYIATGPDMSGIVVLSPAEIGNGERISAYSISLGLHAVEWKTKTAQSHSFIADRNETIDERLFRLIFCVLDDLNVHGEVFWGDYEKYFSEDPTLRVKIEKMIAQMFVESQVGRKP